MVKRSEGSAKAPSEHTRSKPTRSLRGPSNTKRVPSTKASATANAISTPDKIHSTREFYLDDHPKTFFPLATNRVLLELGEPEIREYIDKCLSSDDANSTYSFANQTRVFVSKPNGYLRRTMKLDVVAEYYLYDVVYRNKDLFRKPHQSHRAHYGYRFSQGCPISATEAYKGFKGGISAHLKTYKHSQSMDVATYFNSLYHHDIVSWFHDMKVSDSDAEGLGQLLREISAGRSIDCLPQGLYPSKMIGNDFLRFVDNYFGLKSEQYIRFMDDIILFSDSSEKIADDFQTVQQLLGQKGLSLNSKKTRLDDANRSSAETEIDKMKKKLLRRRRLVITTGYDDDGADVTQSKILKWPLNDDELDYLDTMLSAIDIEEEDAELLLTVLRGYAVRLEKRLPYIFEKFPHLAKNVYSFCLGLPNKEAIAEMVLSLAAKKSRLPESQLYWMCAMLSDQLISTSRASSLISVLFEHQSATPITKAKILEIPDTRFGLQDLRNLYLGAGQSDWLGWSSAVGSRVVKPASRNHVLKYWGKVSNMNNLVASIIVKSDGKV